MSIPQCPATDIDPVRSVFLRDARSVRLLQRLLKPDVPTSSRMGINRAVAAGFVGGMQRVEETQQGGRND